MLASSRKCICILWGLCRFVLFSAVFDTQLSDLAILTSHLKPLKLSVNLWLKKKKWKKKRRKKGYSVAQHTGDLRFNSHFLSPPALAKLLRQLFSAAIIWLPFSNDLHTNSWWCWWEPNCEFPLRPWQW